MKWEEIDIIEAQKIGGCLPATLHYFEPKDVFLRPLDESPEPQEELWQDAADLISRMQASLFHPSGIVQLLKSKFTLTRK